MTTYNTGNPLGSVDVRDLYDNAQNADNFSNGPLDAYPDRFGVSRQSLQGIRNSSQYQVIGAYAAGLQITAMNQVFSYLGEFYAPGPTITLPYTTTGAEAGEIANFRSVGDAILRSDLLAPDGAGRVGYAQTTVNARLKESVSIKEFGGVCDGVTNDTAAVQLAINAVGASGTPIDLGGFSVYCSGALVDSYGANFVNGKILVPSLISGQKTQRNTYADEVNGLMVARENLYAFLLACSASSTQTSFLYGDSTVETGGAFPVKPHDLVAYAFRSAGVSKVAVTNRGLSGTSWSDLNAIPDLSPSTKLIVIKYGINDAVKPSALATFAADSRAKLTAIRAASNGGVDNLSILLMGPNSTYRPTTGQDARWYESLRNIYLELCSEFDCAYFDTYAYLQQTKNAPGTWMDDVGGGEGIHPSPIAVYWIWWDAFQRYVLGNGNWNVSKSNHFWNVGLATGTVATTTSPQDFPKGVSFWLGLTANGWPIDGIIKVTRHDDGIAEMSIGGQGVVPITMTRRGSATTWTQWTNMHAAPTLINSWANKGGGYNTAGFMVHPDGWVSLYGTITGGTLGTSAFLLPVSARPGAAHLFLTAGGLATGTAATITVFADGNVSIGAASNVTISLDGIRFRYGA